MKKSVKVLLSILAASIATVGLVFITTTSAQARSGNIWCTDNGNLLCLGNDGSINIGDKTIQEVNTEARDINETVIDNNCDKDYGAIACARVYLSFAANGDRLGTVSGNNDCTDLIYAVSSTEGTGTVWVLQALSNGNYYIENQHCFGAVMSSDDTNEGDWHIAIKGASGYEQQMVQTAN